jgi:hypothetical protein
MFLVSTLVLAVTAVRGPDYFWFLFWSGAAFRAALFTVLIGLGLWAVASSHWMGYVLSGGRNRLAGGSVLAAIGLTLVLVSALMPDLEGTLAALDDPFQLLPMRRAIINGIIHYAGLPERTLLVPALLGVGLFLLGVTVRGRGHGVARVAEPEATGRPGRLRARRR